MHRRPAEIRDARLAVLGLRSVCELVAIHSGQVEFIGPQAWQGVRVGSRFFAWDGPLLHALEDRQSIPAPESALDAIRRAGLRPFFGTKAKLRRRLAEGALQVYETDKQTWRRELIHSPDSDQVVLVRLQPAETQVVVGR